MSTKLKSVLSGLLEKAYNFQPDEIAELIDKSDEELDDSVVLASILDKDKARIGSHSKTKFDDGYKKAEKKVRSEVESKLKELFGVESDAEGEELFEVIKTKSTSSGTGKQGKDFTPDEIKKHPVFLDMEKIYKSQLDKTKSEFEEKLTTREKEWNRERTFGSVSKKALEIFESLNPILSTDTSRAANQKNDFLGKFRNFEFEEVEGKVIISKDGKVLEDEHGHKVDFDKLVRTTAEQYFDFKKAEDRKPSTGGGGTPPPPQGGGYSGKLPASEKEWAQMMEDNSISLVDKRSINEHWSKQSQGG